MTLKDYFIPVLKAANKIDVRVLRLVAVDNVVSIEPVGYITLGETAYEVPVAGFLILEERGKLSEWRDYFGHQALSDQGGSSLASAADAVEG